ncbi:hypothetical protein ILYODFUR_036177 [Ilyodon furcidens]|uniref:Cadherin domain-containing protein n=1 Tax=Ilyodon furcidens TaxID=33524 RepID=A0ABV0T6D9_9TELE
MNKIVFDMQLANHFATDGDEPSTVNSQIVFSIKESLHSGSFSIDANTGMLKNNAEVDREALDPKDNGRINLTVIATDKGTPSLSGSVSVVIVVEVGAIAIYIHPSDGFLYKSIIFFHIYSRYTNFIHFTWDFIW